MFPLVTSPLLLSPGQQAQLQAQLQFVTNSLLAPRSRVQRANARNQSIIVGNLGAVTTGAQNASPVNVG